MISAIMIGAGARGIGVYGEYANNNPSRIKFVAVAEPDAERRMYFAAVHKLEPKALYESSALILNQKKLADCCFICTQDTKHIDSALKAMDLGYHVFLEKPMAVTPEDCLKVVEKAKEKGVKVMIAHVLRYTPFFAQIKEWLDQGEIGRLMSIQHNENVSYWHQAHSYVRGNWGNASKSSPMILAKSCHDLDLLCWFSSSKPKKVSSFGMLSHFKEEHAPKDAPPFCLDGCPHQDQCLYYAPRVYLNAPIWMKLAVANDMTDSGLMKALEKGPYGRCVYQSDNDVVDHQVTIIEYENEVTAAFTMTGFTKENTRTIKLMGTTGEIRGHLEKNELELSHFGEDKIKKVSLGEATSEHGGGDIGIMDDFVDYLDKDIYRDKFSLDDSLTSHLLAFAAEKARKQGRVIEYETYLEGLKKVVFETCSDQHYYSTLRLLEKVFCENMVSEYPLLLGKENQNQMFIARSDSSVMASVNYYHSTIMIEDSKLAVGSIGSVATATESRNQGLAKKLLEMAITDMDSKKISLAIISGLGGVYENLGATRVGNVIGFELVNRKIIKNIVIKDYDDRDFDTISGLYAKERLRYRRSLPEFRKLLAGQLLPRKMEIRHLNIIQGAKGELAYIFLIEKPEEDLLLVGEFSGDRQLLADSLGSILLKYGRKRLQIPICAGDPLIEMLKDEPHLLTDQYASFKVVNWERFLKQLEPYFEMKGGYLPKVNIDIDKKEYTITVNEHTLTLKSIHELHQLIFGPNQDIIEAIASSEAKKLFATLFPLPFVWTNNLNYQ